jgi:hypothetical protein
MIFLKNLNFNQINKTSLFNEQFSRLTGTNLSN